MAEDVGCTVRVVTRPKELGQVNKIVPGRDERGFVSTLGTPLGDTHGGWEAIADTHAIDGLFLSATLEPKMFERLGGTTVTDGPVGFTVEVAQVTQITDALPVLVIVRIG